MTVSDPTSGFEFFCATSDELLNLIRLNGDSSKSINPFWPLG